MEARIVDLITHKMSGEWGLEANTGEGVKVIRTANFTNLGVINFENLVYRKIDANKVRQKKLLKGDIIIEKSGGSPNQPVGRVVFFDLETEDEYLCNNFTTVLRPDKIKIYPKYLFFQLFIAHIQGKTLKFQNKTTGIINLKLDNYLKEKIFIPPYDDQIRIAQTLSKIEVLIEKRKESLLLLNEFVKSVFLKMFGDPVKNEKEWDTIKLNEVVLRLDTGKSIQSVSKESAGDFKVLKTSAVSWGSFNKDESKWLPKGYVPPNSHLVKKGDILLSRMNTTELVGASTYVFDDVKNLALPDRIWKFILSEEKQIDSLFLWYCINWSSFRRTISEISSGTSGSMKNITKGGVMNLKMIYPTQKLQFKFGLIVEKTEDIKTKYKNSLQELENLYRSLSQKAFKGELDLSKVVIEEEWHNFEGNEPEEQDPIKRKKNKKYFENEIKKLERGDYDNLDTRYGDPFDIDEQTAKSKGKKFYSEWKKLHSKKPKSKLTWDKVSSQQIAEWVKDKYQGYHFSNEMLIRFLMEEHVTFPDYYSSEELKKYPHLNGADDLKSFVFSAINKENPFIELEQLFYDAENENMQLNVSEEDFELIKDREKKERSGIYFNIIK
ncbi:MAG: restriction endonuclease subunit [Bacteroidota bacterium]|jgi:type I restriction enzyme S subunit|nr:restriction endonuclease subunit [Bacteroidota bacterium]